MASGRTHQKFNYFTIIVTTIVIAILFIMGYISSIYLIAWFVAGMVFGFFIDPDWDHQSTTISEYRIAKILSPTLTWLGPKNKEYTTKVLNMYIAIIKLWSYPFALFVPHRSWASHLPVVADIIRLMYVIWSLMFIWSMFGILGASIASYLDWIGNLDYIISSIIDYNKDLFWLIFSTDYWQEKVAIVLGSALLTLSHLTLDKFGVRW